MYYFTFLIAIELPQFELNINLSKLILYKPDTSQHGYCSHWGAAQNFGYHAKMFSLAETAYKFQKRLHIDLSPIFSH